MTEIAAQKTELKTMVKPRLGFLGAGWIGRNRLEAIASSGLAEIVAITEPASESAKQASELAPEAELFSSYQELLESNLDGIVIATPSALHAEQAIAAFEHGLAVFCQKPLARNAEETRRVVEAAREANKLLSVDFSYRFISGVKEIRDLISSGELGEIFAVNLVFHNAYGPDKPWFYDPKLSGGGCAIDLGIHLIDLAMWMLDFPQATKISSQLFAGGKPLGDRNAEVEDYATAQIEFGGKIAVQLACSWRLNAGCEAVIEAAFYGTHGGAALRNVDGSFFDFTAERFQGTSKSELSEPNCNNKNWKWGGQAAVEWTRRLAAGEKFDSACERLIDVAATLDCLYGS